MHNAHTYALQICNVENAKILTYCDYLLDKCMVMHMVNFL